jgi:hypothetical protein
MTLSSKFASLGQRLLAVVSVCCMQQAFGSQVLAIAAYPAVDDIVTAAIPR